MLARRAAVSLGGPSIVGDACGRRSFWDQWVKYFVTRNAGYNALVSTRATEQYDARIRNTMGAAKADGFVRYDEIPGYGHAVSSVFNAARDSLTTLENWVESGTTPPNQIVADTAGLPGGIRPLCDFPAFPRYRGTGDVNLAASFGCALQ